jgi:hypothetical protein
VAEQASEEATGFVPGDWGQLMAGLVAVNVTGERARLDGCHDGEERVSEHRQDRPSHPGGPGPDPMLVEGGELISPAMPSSTFQRIPATATSTCSGTSLGACAR